jgi:hypothetical protein
MDLFRVYSSVLQCLRVVNSTSMNARLDGKLCILLSVSQINIADTFSSEYTALSEPYETQPMLDRNESVPNQSATVDHMLR